MIGPLDALPSVRHESLEARPAALPAIDHDLEVNGLRLHVRETGPADAPRALVLHGIMGHVREWDTLTARLAGELRVVALDQRGHGRSDWADTYTTAALADDLLDVLDQLAIRPEVVVGHSMGAMAALVATERRPALTDHLVLLDVGPDSITPELAEGLLGWLELLASSSYAHVDEAVDLWLEGDPYARADLMIHYVTHALRPRDDGRLVWRFDAAKLGRFVTAGVAAAELARAADAVTVPTLVVRGVHSEVLPAAAARAFVDRLARGELAAIPDAAHDLGVQQPEAVADTILAFLRRHRSAPAPRG